MTKKIENVVGEHFAYELLKCVTNEHSHYCKSESPDYILGDCGLEIVTSISNEYKHQTDIFFKRCYKKNIGELDNDIISPEDVITDENGTMLAFGYGGWVTNDILIASIDKKLEKLNNTYKVKNCDLFIFLYEGSMGDNYRDEVIQHIRSNNTIKRKFARYFFYDYPIMYCYDALADVLSTTLIEESKIKMAHRAAVSKAEIELGMKIDWNVGPYE